jgi:predicted RNA-binding Zn ribbon-like protein
MLSREVAPDAGFSFRSDRLCLDFAATLMFRGSDHPKELLASPANLTAWAFASGVVSGPTDCDATDLAEAARLREAIYRTAAARIAGHRGTFEDVAMVNRHGQVAPVVVTLSRDGTVGRSGAMASVLASIARDAIELLGGPAAQRLRQCGRDGCTRMFIDRSHGHNRTWCGMRECGNRVNAAAYRQRRHQAQDPS